MGSRTIDRLARGRSAGDAARVRLEELTGGPSAPRPDTEVRVHDDPGARTVGRYDHVTPEGVDESSDETFGSPGVERPVRRPAARLDVEAWREPPWWSRIRVAPGPAAGAGLVVVVLVVAVAILVRLDSTGEDYSGVEAPTLPGPSEVSSAADPLGAADSVGTPDGSGDDSASGDLDAVASTPVAAGDADLAEAASEPVVVSVVGLVEHSGLVTLPAGSRVAHALEAAGGTLPGADRDGLNLARRMADGEQILVGTVPTDDQPGARSAILAPDGAPASGPGGTAAGGAADGAPADGAPGAGPADGGGSDLVDINTADDARLQSLPGVGPATSAAILAWRRDNGAFGSVDQLIEVSGIGPATLERIRPLVAV